MSYSIINIWDSTLQRNIATPVEYSYGNAFLANGNITTFTSNTSIIGDITCNFTADLGRNYVIKNISNVYVGHVDYTANANIAFFKANANVAITSNNFYVLPFSYTSLRKDPNVGTGNITVYTSNNTVIGNGTTFLTELDTNFQIFDNTSVDYPNLIGVIRTITSNTEAKLNANSYITMVNKQFRFYSPITPNKPNIFVPNTDKINSALIEWGQSGLIKGIKQVKSFHAPMPDPVTGILVNFPATIHDASQVGNVITTKLEDSHIHNIPSHQHTTKTYNVKEFNDDHSIVGSSLHKAIDSVPINRVIKKLAESQTDPNQYTVSVQSVINTIYGNSDVRLGTFVFDTAPAGFVRQNTTNVAVQPFEPYVGPDGNVIYVRNVNANIAVYNTIADKLALFNNLRPIPRITDDLTDSKQYYSAPRNAATLSDAEKSELSSRAGDKVQFNSDEDKQLTVTGVPAVVPGQFNAVLFDENPVNKPFVRPRYRPTTMESNFTFNPDIPTSALNPRPIKD